MGNVSDTISRVSAADLSASEYLIVAKDADGKIVLATAATDDIAGVLVEGGKASGDAVAIQVYGEGWVTLGDSVNEGDWLTTNASSKAIATTTDGNVVLGQAQEAGVVDDKVRVLFNMHTIYVA